MATNLDIKTINTIGGAFFGGSLLEDDRDVFGTLLGLAIGGVTGSLLKVNYSNLQNIMPIEENFRLVGDKPVNDVERLKAEIANLKASDLDELPSDPAMKFDPDRPIDTVTKENIKEAAKSSDNLAILKKLDTFSKNPTEALEELDVTDLPIPNRERTNAYLQGNTDLEVKKTQLSRYFRDRGYRGKELEEKAAIFNNLLDNDQPLVLGANTDKIEIGGHSIKVVSSAEATGVSSYLDTANFSAVQKLNPFASFAKVGNTGDAMAAAIGIQFAEAADSDMIKATLEESVYKGMKPDDLKALLVTSDNFTPKAIDQYTSKGYQYQGYESGLRAQGLSREAVLNGATDLSRVVSNTIDVGEIFNIDREHTTIDKISPFRNIGTVAKHSTGSELKTFLGKVSKDLDLPNVKINMNPDNVASYTTTMVDDSINILADAARKVNTTSSRTNPVSFSRDSTTGTAKAFRELSELGLVPRQYSTASAVSRLTIDDWKGFNNNLYDRTNIPNMILADGASITSKEKLQDYKYSMYEKSSVSATRGQSVTLTSKVVDTLQKGANLGLGTLSVPFSPGIKKLVNTTNKVTKAKEKLSVIESNFKTKKSEYLTNIKEGFKPKTTLTTIPNQTFKPITPKALMLNTSNKQDFSFKIPMDSKFSKTKGNFLSGLTPEFSKYSLDVTKQQATLGKVEVTLERQKAAIANLETLVDTRIKDSYKQMDYLENHAYTSKEDSLVYGQAKEALLRPREEALDFATKYNELAGVKFYPNEILGFNANGTTVTTPDTMASYTLMSANNRMNQNFSNTTDLIFKGDTVIGENDNYIKQFGAGSKLNNQLFGNSDFKVAEALAWTEALGYNIDPVDSSISLKGVNVTPEEFQTTLGNHGLGREIGTIARADDAGLSLATDIMNNYQNGTLKDYFNPENISKRPGVSETLSNSLMEVAEYLKTSELNIAGEVGESNPWRLLGGIDSSRSSGWALGMFATSLIEGKSTADAVMGMKVMGLRNTNTLLDNIENLPTNPSQRELDKYRGSLNLLEDIFNTKDFVISELDPADARKQVTDKFLERMEVTASSYNSNLDTIISGDIFKPEHVDMYRLAYPTPQESLSIGFIDVSSTKNYRSGSGFKNMSHSSQSHLVRNGYSLAEIGLFGSHSAENIYDMNIITASNKVFKEEDTLNYFFESEGKDRNYTRSFMEKLRRIEPEDVNRFLDEQGVYPSIKNQDALYYTMQEEIDGFKTVALPKNSTSRIGSFITSSEAKVTKSLGRDLINLADKDLEHATAKTEASKVNLTEAGSKLKANIVDIIGGRANPALKGLFSLEAGNSSYSVVLPATGMLDTLNSDPDLNKGYSYVGITEERAKTILKGNGIEIPENDLSKFLSSNNILQTQTVEGNLRDYTALQAREPTLSEFSLKPIKYYVAGSSKEISTLNDNAVYVSREDKAYAALMVGDFDLDHTLMYNPEKQMTNEQALQLESTMERHQANRQELLELTEHLSIKGKVGKDKYSLDKSIDYVMDNLEKYSVEGKPLIPGTPEFREKVYDRQQVMLQEGTMKAGHRKINTPQLVKLSTNLADTIDTIEEVNFRPIQAVDKEALRGLNHHLVENLIKMQHEESNPDIAQTSVEKLLKHKNDYYDSPTLENRNLYKESLKTNYDSLLERSTPKIKEKYTPLIDTMIEAELVHAESGKVTPRNVGDIPENVPRMKASNIDVTVDITESIMKNVGLIETESMGTTNVARTARGGYNNITTFAKKTFRENKSVLAVGAGALALGSLMTQKDPDFEDHRPVRGDIGGMMLEANADSIQKSKDLPNYTDSPSSSKTGYITPDYNYTDPSRVINSALRIKGSYNNYEQDINQSMKKAIFGNNISNVRIDKSYDY